MGMRERLARSSKLTSGYGDSSLIQCRPFAHLNSLSSSIISSSLGNCLSQNLRTRTKVSCSLPSTLILKERIDHRVSLERRSSHQYV